MDTKNGVISISEDEELRVQSGHFDQELAVTLYSSFDKYFEVKFPTLVSDYYLIKPKRYIGIIPVTEDVTFRIRPKVPVGNVFRMLEYAYNLRSFEFIPPNSITVDALDDVFERLASILARRVLDRARKGLYRHYVAEQESLRHLRGRLRIVQTLGALARGSTSLQCEYENHTADLEDNQILAWTLYRLPRMRIQRQDIRRQVRQAYRVLAGAVDVVRVDSGACVNRLYHRLNDDYRPMHGLCRFFLEHCGPGMETGQYGFIPFALRMDYLFESFVAKWLDSELPERYNLTPQYRAILDENRRIFFEIDLVLRESESDRVLAVLDTKYKRHTRPADSDIQQIAAYALAMRTRNAFLVYPSSVTQPVELTLGDVKVRSIVFDIGQEIEQSGKAFLSSIEATMA
jgi:5-methylcytosine-specific restriction enzyme subunit McrC